MSPIYTHLHHYRGSFCFPKKCFFRQFFFFSLEIIFSKYFFFPNFFWQVFLLFSLELSRNIFFQSIFWLHFFSKILIVPDQKMKEMSGKNKYETPPPKKQQQQLQQQQQQQPRLSNITVIDWQGYINILWTWRELISPRDHIFPQRCALWENITTWEI